MQGHEGDRVPDLPDFEHIEQILPPAAPYPCYPAASCFRHHEGVVADALADAPGAATLCLNIQAAGDSPQHTASPLSDIHLGYLAKEIALQAAKYPPGARVEQLLIRSGQQFSDLQLQKLLRHLYSHFIFAPDSVGDYAVEIAPGKDILRILGTLRRAGLNRLNITLYDLSPAETLPLSKVCSEADLHALMAAARNEGFRTIAVELGYGLPNQTTAAFETLIDKVIKSGPDRLAITHYQAERGEAGSPDAAAGASAYATIASAAARLSAAGYIACGANHYVRPGDALAHARDHDRLQLGLTGYSTQIDAPVLGIGLGMISQFATTYHQNCNNEADYRAHLDRGMLPICRSHVLTRDDQIRQQVIRALLCHFGIHVPQLERSWAIRFADYFGIEWPQLCALGDAGVLRIDGDGLWLTTAGRLLAPRVAAVFDVYRRNDRQAA